jgi:hypothetical protein
MENNKLNGFNNGIDASDGVGGKKWCDFMDMHTMIGLKNLENIPLEFKNEIMEEKTELQEAINVLQKHFAPKGDVNKLQSQMLNSKKLEILKSIANAGGIDWDEVTENERIISLKLKTF